MNAVYDLKANAKVNIFLRVCGKYPNGYHRLLMLMQEIDLGDDISVSLDDSLEFDIKLNCNFPGLEVEKNLCYKAADRYYAALKAKRIASGKSELEAVSDFCLTTIDTVKNVPSEAGLGGGSSDAAAVLLALDDYYENALTQEEMINLAATLGADVPFFLMGGSSFCEGIGEIITPAASLSGLHMILVKPSVGVPTGKCFNLCDEFPVEFDEDSYKSFMVSIFNDEALSPVERIKRARDLLTNDLEAPAMEITLEVAEVKSLVMATNPVFTMMSGSGSTVFAIYEDEKSSSDAYSFLKSNDELADCQIIKTVTL